MKLLESHSDLRMFIKNNEIALIAFLDMNKANDRYFHDVLTVLERRAGYMISFAFVDIGKDSDSQALLPQGRVTPLVRLYVRGVKTFEQEGCFGEFLSDLAALKQGIKDVLKSRGYKTLF
ncbi:MAG: hypothetical protein DRO15_05620 [Thermoprotei archaeon]|nr:MAG: hypothetical protein DRO15_05620 [Thermoprotei archaeon]